MNEVEGRFCPECNKFHNTVLERTDTEAVIEHLDMCRECLLGKCQIIDPYETIVLMEGMTDEEIHLHLGETLLKIMSKFNENE